MKDAWWAIWGPTIGDLHEAFIKNRPDQFWAAMRKLRDTVDGLLDDGQAMAACMGVAADGYFSLGPKEKPKQPRRSCQNCRHWNGPGTRRLCGNAKSSEYMIYVGAGSVCDEHGWSENRGDSQASKRQGDRASDTERARREDRPETTDAAETAASQEGQATDAVRGRDARVRCP